MLQSTEPPGQSLANVKRECMSGALKETEYKRENIAGITVPAKNLETTVPRHCQRPLESAPRRWGLRADQVWPEVHRGVTVQYQVPLQWCDIGFFGTATRDA